MRIYGKKSGRNKPGAMFARSYMYYSRQNQRRKNTCTRYNSEPRISTENHYLNEYISKTPEERDNAELAGMIILIFMLACIVFFCIASQVTGDNELGWLFWLCVVLLSYSVYSLKGKIDAIKIRRVMEQERGLEQKVSSSNVPQSLLIKEKEADIRQMISEREPIIQQKEKVEKELSDFNGKLLKTKAIKSRIEELAEEKNSLEKVLGEKTYRIVWKRTERYNSFEKSMEYLRHTKVVLRKGDYTNPDISNLFIPCKYVEEKNGFIKFSPTPVCMEIDGDWFCITSDAIYCFDKEKGTYKGCVGTKEYSITRTTECWTEKEPYTTWTYRRVDGGPDRRYKNNPMITCYAEHKRSSNDVICIRIMDKKVSYQVEPASRDYIMKNKARFEPA